MTKILSWWMILAIHVTQLVFNKQLKLCIPKHCFFITFGLSVIPKIQDSLANADTCHIFLTFSTHWFHIYILYFMTSILTVFVKFKFNW